MNYVLYSVFGLERLLTLACETLFANLLIIKVYKQTDASPHYFLSPLRHLSFIWAYLYGYHPSAASISAN